MTDVPVPPVTSPVRHQDGDAPESGGSSELGGLRAIRSAAECLLVTHSLPRFGARERDMAWEGLVEALDYAGKPSPPSEGEAVAVLRELVRAIRFYGFHRNRGISRPLGRADAVLSAAPETRTGSSEEAETSDTQSAATHPVCRGEQE